MVYSVVNGDFLVNFAESQAAENVLKRALKDHQIKGFSNVLIAQKVEEGLSALIQTAGLGGLRFVIIYFSAIICSIQTQHRSLRLASSLEA